MSYILEALRKSEGERDTGRVPDLTAQHELTSEGLDPDEARRPLWPWLLCAAFAANAGLLAYVFWPRMPAAAEVKPVAAEAAKAAAPVVEPAPTVAATGTQPAPGAAASVTQPAPVYAQPAYPPQAYVQPGYAPGYPPPAYTGYPPAAYAQAQLPAYGPGAQPYAGTPPAGYGPGAPAAYGQVAPAYAPPQPTAYAQAAYPATGYAQPAPAYAPTNYQTGPGQAPGETLPELADGDTLVTPAGVQTQDANAVPALEQMPELFRSQVPPMSFSTHVYSSNRAKSFVVINGQTFGPGAQVFPGIQLEAVVEDGVVFNYQGRRFKMDALKNWPEN